MVDPAGRERDAEGFGDVLLADHLGELGRAVLPVQSQRHAREATHHDRQRGSPGVRTGIRTKRGLRAPGRAR
ncbi:hypothetical protein PSU4_25470 [Pseudonocardia sulfidoxydans NBRC 16205]|uniref:Uncharacterized protein n=1 Tax=Pseudonocardia sulfidoxydans NBRC 16205 TaxID=1223511 RepID=A0A511DGT4_9PSEU|nr:hypothetical protein PSU4_25470 [Pseudonocardia sulfidoxydans NBRC 16205]